jgi:O-acetyl-ADP-ribose deacetylase (regulator of RNase III)
MPQPTFLQSANIFTLDVDAIVNPVNCVGIMGKGLAAAFKLRYPDNFKAYAAICRERHLSPGGLFAFKHPTRPEPWILNVATKEHWRDDSKLADVESCARELVAFSLAHHLRTVACPALGAGNGHLPWPKVRAILESAFDCEHTDFTVICPQTPEPRPSTTAGRTGFRKQK